jgi:hypothetical protein
MFYNITFFIKVSLHVLYWVMEHVAAITQVIYCCYYKILQWIRHVDVIGETRHEHRILTWKSLKPEYWMGLEHKARA